MWRVAVSIALVSCVGCSAGNGAGGGDLGGGGGAGGGGVAVGGGGGGAGCVPMCSGIACGDDGCGGACGACDANALCQAGACMPLSGNALIVDAAGGRHAIHAEVYGLAFASPATLKELNVVLNRWGGDGTTLFNWQTSVGNHDFSYFYENIPGGSADDFVTANRGAGAATLMTIPTIGWTPKTGSATNHPYTCGYPIEKYPNQQMVDPYDTHCGNGRDSAGNLITGDPTNDAMTVTPSFEGDWVQHLGAGVRLFQLDNEMMLWPSTHHDVRSTPVSSDDVWSATTNYAPVIKSGNPSAYVLGYTAWYALDLWSAASTRRTATRPIKRRTAAFRWRSGTCDSSSRTSSSTACAWSIVSTSTTTRRAAIRSRTRARCGTRPITTRRGSTAS